MRTVGLALWSYLSHSWTNGLEADLLGFVVAEVDKLAPGTVTDEVVHKIVGDYILKLRQAAAAQAPAPAAAPAS
ncbi:MAG: hypothetical protein K2R98_08440 [Gemmataceae bacterium]|nr:hypothetical protein [Gemmataceae bacterium]